MSVAKRCVGMAVVMPIAYLIGVAGYVYHRITQINMWYAADIREAALNELTEAAAHLVMILSVPTVVILLLTAIVAWAFTDPK